MSTARPGPARRPCWFTRPSLYVGLRSDRYFVERGTPLKVDLIVTDLDGKPVTDQPIEVRAARLEWKIRNGTWNEEEVDVQTCNRGLCRRAGHLHLRNPDGRQLPDHRQPSPMTKGAPTRASSPAGSAAASCPRRARWSRKKSP